MGFMDFAEYLQYLLLLKKPLPPTAAPMVVTCDQCGRTYDDAKRWTICPHNRLDEPVDKTRSLVIMEEAILSPEETKAYAAAMDILGNMDVRALIQPLTRTKSFLAQTRIENCTFTTTPAAQAAMLTRPDYRSDLHKGELVFPAYSVVAFNPSPIPSLNPIDHGKLLAMMAKRSVHWEAKRLAHISANPYCAVCGSTQHLNVHHVLPFHVRPDLELVDSNLLTLGEACPHGNHHFLFGHFLNWKKANPNVAADATRFLAAILTSAAGE